MYSLSKQALQTGDSLVYYLIDWVDHFSRWQVRFQIQETVSSGFYTIVQAFEEFVEDELYAKGGDRV